MPSEEQSRNIHQLATKREEAIVAYRRAQLAVAEVHADFIKAALKGGALTPKDLGSMMCW